MKKLFLFLLLTFGAAILTTAQETALSVLFYNYQDAGSTQGLMKNNSSYSDWEFNNYCIDLKGTKYFFKVGDGTNNGVFATPALNLNGNATLLIKTLRVSGTAKFRVSIEGEGKVGNNNYQEYTITSTDTYRPSAIYISECTPSSKIKIEGVSGSFKVLSMKVYSIYDAIFYESFNYMDGTGGTNGNFKPNVDIMSDNAYSYFDYSSETTYNTIHKCDACISIIANSDYYKTPAMNKAITGDALLTFRAAGTQDYSNQPLTITCENNGSLSTTSFTLTKSAWNTYWTTISGVKENTKLSFCGGFYFLDDIMVNESPVILSQLKDNSSIIEDADNKTSTVPLIRTLTPNVWCPLCLPFDVTPELMAREVGSCQVCTLSGISGGVFSFSDVAEGTIIDAGTPFLVKVATQVVNPVFHNVTISNTAAKTVTFDGADGYEFVGTYSPVTLNTDGTHLFLGTDGMLYKPGTEDGYNRLGGLRAYFEIPSSAASGTRVDINDNANAIITLSAETVTSTGTFDLQGRRMPQGPLSQGLYISNGRKVLIR